jgi:hypothetical protein
VRRHLEFKLDLAVMVALVPQYVLQQEDRVVVVKVHVPACCHPALYRVPHRPGAAIQHLRDAIAVTLAHPLFFWYVPGELGSILENEHKTNVVDMRE